MTFDIRFIVDLIKQDVRIAQILTSPRLRGDPYDDQITSKCILPFSALNIFVLPCRIFFRNGILVNRKRMETL